MREREASKAQNAPNQFFHTNRFFFNLNLKKGFITFSEAEQQDHVAFIMNWLTQQDNDGPRLLKIRSENDFFMHIFSAVREVNQICDSIFNGIKNIF